MHSHVPVNPARGEAQGRIVAGVITVITGRTADGSRSPEVEAELFARSTACWIHSFLVNQIGGRSSRRKSIGTRMNRHERHVGPVGQKCHDHPDAGSNLRRERTPGAPPDEATHEEGRTTRPARPRDCPGMRVAERRAKRTRRRMTRPGGEITRRRRNESSIGGSAASVREKNETSRFHRPHPRDGPQTTELESIRSCPFSERRTQRTWLNAGPQDWARKRPPDRATPRCDLPIKRKTAGAKRAPSQVRGT